MQAGVTSCVTTKATLSMILCLGVLTDTWRCHLLTSSACIPEQMNPRGFQQKQRFPQSVPLLRIKQATPTDPEDTQSLLKIKKNLSSRAIGNPPSLCDLRELALQALSWVPYHQGWNIAQLRFCKENRKPKLHYFTPNLESKLEMSSKLHFVFGQPQANRILKILPVFSSTPQGTKIITWHRVENRLTGFYALWLQAVLLFSLEAEETLTHWKNRPK